MRKRIIMLLLCVIIVDTAAGTPAVSAADYNVGLVEGLDLSAMKISGDKCEYYFNIPEAWADYIVIERERLNPGNKILEKLNFYFQPVINGEPPVFLASMFIYEKRFSNDNNLYKRLLETDEYVFMLYVSATDPVFTNKGDLILYNFFITELSDINAIKELFVFPEGKGPVAVETLIVNGAALSARIVFKENNTAYIPLRAACEALGYTLVWHAYDASIYIQREGFEYTLYTDSAQNYGAVRVEDSFYVPAMFFMQVLKTHFEVDIRGNVFITE